jgi:thiol:disulfide interchange protein
LPFTIFAMFPALLKNLKSGSWLNSVKVVLGFIEVALGFKFLSTADMTYHWGILDREVYLAIWIVVFTLLGLYLLGKIRFANDDKVEHIGIFRLILVIVDFTFVVYMIPGMFGAPLKAISGYLPPIETQDFILGSYQAPIVSNANDNATANDKATFKLPYGLKGFSSLDEGLAEASKVGKPVFVDITGFGCTNCREMEARVWSDTKVLSMLQNDFIIVALSTDDKTKIPENERIKDENGKILKDYGRLNSYIVRTKFGVNAQPNYALLSPNGTQLVPIRGYNLNVDGFVKFLQSGLDAYNSNR